MATTQVTTTPLMRRNGKGSKAFYTFSPWVGVFIYTDSHQNLSSNILCTDLFHRQACQHRNEPG